jgi:parallel beta-helix repeat protein
MLVANNICFGNGGDGITLFRSNHVDVINNTVYLNDQSPSINRGGICPNQTQNSTIMNNIIFAPAGKMAMAGNPLVADYNLYWSSSGSPSNSLIQTLGTHDRKADPLFINASLNSALADFHVQYGSPAIDGGASVVARVGSTVNAPTTDFSGNMRPSGGGYDIGAYEYVPTRAEPGNAMHAVVPSQLTVSPNPCRGIAGIQLGSTGDVRIMPMNGAAVDAFHSVRSAQWDTRALPAGMYTVEANTGGVRLSRELVVVK